MRFEKITIKDVAKALGVSTSTVSRALRDSYEIGADTKKRVLEYSQKMNFKPNQMASSLKARTSKSIGIVVSEIANSFFAQVMDGIESVAHKKGYNVIITQTHGCSAREIANVIHLASHSVDGILISLSPGTIDVSHLKELFDKKMPIVFFDRVSDEIKTHKVACNNVQGAYDAVSHFIDKGYKKVAFLGGAQHLSNIQERFLGYKEALAASGIVLNEDHIKFCQQAGGMHDEEAEHAIKTMLGSANPPEAFLICGDRLTGISLKYFKNNNIKIPDDISVICFSNQDFTELLNPPLTTIYQPAFEIGGYATDLLFQLINSKVDVKKFEYKRFPCQLNIRDSVGSK